MPLDLQLAEADKQLVAVARDTHILGAISWQESTVETFLEGWHRGNPQLPQIEARPPARLDSVLEFDRLAATPGDSPAAKFLRETAASYSTACRMVSEVGTATAFEASCELYETPSVCLPGSKQTYREAASRILDITAPLQAATATKDGDYCIPAEAVAREMKTRFEKFFGSAAPKIVVDPTLSSKAAASALRIRLRGGACFSFEDIEQLIEHEGFIHSATSLNGRQQPYLTSLSLSAPRTTAAQEGLATVAELITGAMDLTRLRRLALRVVAIDEAIAGANFIEVFRFFFEQGQTEIESAYSAARIFRGGDVRGRYVFTKDVVYLRGLFSVHTFLRRAMIDVRPELVSRLFVGRLTLADILRLEPLFEDGTIAPPHFVPVWATKLRSLAATMSFSALLNQIDLNSVDLEKLWS
jgi:uncharacterized protein (TIGR02421 family)